MDKGRLEGINGGMVENGSHLAIDLHRCDTVQGLLANRRALPLNCLTSDDVLKDVANLDYKVLAPRSRVKLPISIGTFNQEEPLLTSRYFKASTYGLSCMYVRLAFQLEHDGNGSYTQASQINAFSCTILSSLATTPFSRVQHVDDDEKEEEDAGYKLCEGRCTSWPRRQMGACHWCQAFILAVLALLLASNSPLPHSISTFFPIHASSCRQSGSADLILSNISSTMSPSPPLTRFLV